MKLARVMTALGTALAASSLMGGVAYADFVCQEFKPVNEPAVCPDDVFGTGYVATAIANATTVTVTLNDGDGSIVTARTTGFDAENRAVANAALQNQPGESDSDSVNNVNDIIVTHDVMLFAG